jgi:hypothetical protein
MTVKDLEIEIVGLDMMCFRVRADTLEATTCGYYDPWARRHPLHRQMSIGEWMRRRADMRDREEQPR